MKISSKTSPYLTTCNKIIYNIEYNRFYIAEIQIIWLLKTKQSIRILVVFHFQWTKHHLPQS